MLFNSVDFLVFIVVVLVGYRLIPSRFDRARKGLLLVSSYVFYMAWNPPFALLLLASTLLDFIVGLRMARATSPRLRRALLVLSLTGNLGILGYFKYGNFLAENLHALLGPWLRFETPLAYHIILPVGISFYTFQTLSYTLDLYRGRQQPTRSLLDFALFVSFFPQLVAGPIVRARDFLPQLVERRRTTPSHVEEGLIRISTGLLKKVVFADALAPYVDSVFANPDDFAGLNLLLGAYAYAYQIYFDFSGYSDIAIGLALLFGFRILENFDRPYRSANVREFWRHWHISLSTWLRDYLYISLGGNRQPDFRIYLCLAITMLLGGLWHGASWTFVAWGAYHGALLIGHRIWTSRRRGAPPRLPLFVRQILTFHAVCLGWILFRAPSLGEAWAYTAGIARGGLELTPAALEAGLFLAVAVAIEVTTSPRSLQRRFAGAPAWMQGAGYAMIAVLVFLFSPLTERFIYFQF